MGKPKKNPPPRYSEKVRQIIAQMRSGQLLTPQTIKDSISRMLDQEMKM